MSLNEEQRETVQQMLAAEKGAILEHIAKSAEVAVGDVVACLPTEQATTVPGSKFVDVMTEIASWGEITFLVHTDDIVFEARGQVPEGSLGRGYYNLSGKPIGGHLKADNCAFVAFVSRPVFNNDSHSVQFFNHDGGCMFKIYLGRDENRQLISAQVDKFKKYRDQLAGR